MKDLIQICNIVMIYVIVIDDIKIIIIEVGEHIIVDIRESLQRSYNDQMYISSFNDPTVALETTQFNQTYALEQQDQSYGDVEDELNLSPDWNPNFFYRVDDFGNTYSSVDQLEWELLQPTPIEQIIQSPDVVMNETTTLANDYRPVTRSHYSQDLSYPDLSTTQTQVGRLGYSSWSWSRDSSGHADV
jgi:hypothetical protein